ncbi:MAG: DUF4334 domain-containing protein [Oscillospiraceae bacterium]|jgi:hypothetical protein|nr:DUF4334 domain-containing protein [Oscillospiraceae bacterium]
MVNHKTLEALLKNKTITQQEGLDFFDTLEPADVKELKYKWKGSEVPSGHPMDGMLNAVNWYGKYFTDVDNVYPLIFEKNNGKLFAGNPKLMPIKAFETAPRWLVSILFKIATPFIKTKKSSAILRMMEFRGKLTAAMIYDDKPIIDIFAKIDDKTFLGITETKWDIGLYYFFIIKYVGEK